MKLARSFVALLVVGVLGAACGGDDAPEASSGGDEGGPVTLTAANFAFSPADISAGVGDTIEFTNEDDTEHSFTSEEAGIDEDAEGGGSVSISLGDVEPGSYEYVCKYHPEMTGNLEVTE